MAAGIATVGHLIENRAEVYSQLESLSEAVADGVAAEAEKANVPLVTNRVGAMLTWFFTSTAVTDFATAAMSDTAAFARFHRAMLEQGIWLPCSQYEAAFLSTAHTIENVQQTIQAAKAAFAAVAESRGQSVTA
jgi:glutamate-1-semialdehyde 2,1-aminomutase